MNRQLIKIDIKNFLENKFRDRVKAINEHTKRLGNMYCECDECKLHRYELGEIRTQINNIK